MPKALPFLSSFIFRRSAFLYRCPRLMTKGWKWPVLVLPYPFGLAYLVTGITYWPAVAPGL